MKLSLFAAILLATAGLATNAYADISGGPVYSGGSNQFQVRCMIFNAGPGTATITSKTITTGGSPVSTNFDSCKSTLASGKACIFAAPVGQVAHSCRVRSTGGVLRGTVAVYDKNDGLLHSSDMR